MEVYWTGERKYFAGRVTAQRVDDGQLQHRIHYEDGVTTWHDFASVSWRAYAASADNAATVAAVMSCERAIYMAHVYTQQCRDEHKAYVRVCQSNYEMQSMQCFLAQCALEDI